MPGSRTNPAAPGTPGAKAPDRNTPPLAPPQTKRDDPNAAQNPQQTPGREAEKGKPDARDSDKDEASPDKSKTNEGDAKQSQSPPANPASGNEKAEQDNNKKKSHNETEPQPPTSR